MDNGNNHDGRCLLLRICAVLLSLSLAATPAASHEGHGHDTGVHRNFLIIVRTPYDYDHNLYKNVSSWHASLLASVCDMAKEKLEEDPSSVTRLIYSYRNVVNGFAARLTPEELQTMSKKDWFLRAYPERVYQLLTTRTPELLGLMGGAGRGLWNASNMGEGVIIGVLDDGITAGHPSFLDAGMSPPPAKWKGRCDFNSSVCNNKLIGARSFFESAKWKYKGLQDPVLPISEGQHGTHTSSTAAGAFVPGANVLGYGTGTASGMAPRAHISFYQVCYGTKGCDRDDILAAVDEAIDDGVDILSLSIGGSVDTDFADDPVSLAGFTAALNGVFVSAAAGNLGPSPETLANEAPWVLTVGASTVDRRFAATVKLGSGVEVDGESLTEATQQGFGKEMRPLVRDVGNGMCTSENVLRAQNVTGKIVLCDAGGGNSTGDKAKMLLRVGAAGLIVSAPEVFGPVIVPRPQPLPTVLVPNKVGQKIKAYIQSSRAATANFVFKGTLLNQEWPMVAPFSSRGPNMKSPGILKPDIIGPGANILAAVPKIEDLVLPPNTEMPRFDIKSGTSMSAPHVSGIAALIKKAHPTWSPAAIKSALMTTTDTTNSMQKPIPDVDGTPASYYAMGAGHVNAQKAMDPGLVYNLTTTEYIPYLCGLRNMTDEKVSSIIHPEPPVVCAKLPKVEEKDLNYPSITVFLGGRPSTVNVTRTVTNVGAASSTYEVKVDVPNSVIVQVAPPTLTFKAVEEALNYTVTFKTASGKAPGSTIEGQLKWVSGKYVVRSPILIAPRTGRKKAKTAGVTTSALVE